MRWTAIVAATSAFGLSAAGCTLAAGLGEPITFEPSDGGDIADAGPTLQAVVLAVGGTHACATVQGPEPTDPRNGTIRCWGSNAAGELGTDPMATPASAVPLAVVGTDPVDPITSIDGLALSTGYSCATKAGYLYCWGAVPEELASGVHRENAMPPYGPSLMDLRLAQLIGVTGIAAGQSGGAVTIGDALVCWGSAIYELPDGGSGFDSGAAISDTFYGAAVGRAHTCAVATRSGVTDVECWGDNTYGQIGFPPSEDPGPIPYPTPVGLSALSTATIKAIAAGADHTCALMNDSSVYCWGRNDLGQLGNPALTDVTGVPTLADLPNLTIDAIALGDDHSCAASDGEHVRCWGDNSMGQLGQGPSGPMTSAAPLIVQRLQGTPNELPNARHVAAGGQTTCITRYGDPLVWCWGANTWGQAGQSPSQSPTVPYATPVSW